jgi:hypothetical protein
VHRGQCTLNGAERRARNPHLGIRIRHLTHDAALPSPTSRTGPLPGLLRVPPPVAAEPSDAAHLRSDNSTR